MNWYLFGICGLTVSGLLTVFFMMIGRHNSNQEQTQFYEIKKGQP